MRESSSHILLDCEKYEAERVAVTSAIAALADVVESCMHRVVKKRRYDSARAVPAKRHMIDL